MSDLTSLIQSSLHPESRLLSGDDENFAFDLEGVIDLVNGLHADPAGVISTALKYALAVRMLLSSVREDRDSVDLAKKQYYGKKYELYSLADDSNPFHKKAKLTVSFIDSVIDQDEKYLELSKEVIRLDAILSRLYALKDVLESEVELMKILTQYPDRIPTSGLVIDKDTIHEQVEKFKAMLNAD